MDNQIENQVEVQPQNKKSGKGKTVAIIILVILLLGAVGYIAYDKVFMKKTKGPEKTETKVEEKSKLESIDIKSSEVVSLYKALDIFNSSWRVGTDYYGYLYSQNQISATNMPDDVKVFIGIVNALEECGKACSGLMSDGYSTKETISADKVDAQIKKIFGNINYNNVSTKAYFICSDKGYTFQNNEYYSITAGCGQTGLTTSYVQSRIIKAEKNNNELNIYTNVLFAVPNIDQNSDKYSNPTGCASWYDVDCLVDTAIYKDFSKTQLVEKTTENLWDNNGISEQTMAKYQDKLDTYKLHFENENGEYHFKSIAKQ